MGCTMVLIVINSSYGIKKERKEEKKKKRHLQQFNSSSSYRPLATSFYYFFSAACFFNSSAFSFLNSSSLLPGFVSLFFSVAPSWNPKFLNSSGAIRSLRRLSMSNGYVVFDNGGDH